MPLSGGGSPLNSDVGLIRLSILSYADPQAYSPTSTGGPAAQRGLPATSPGRGRLAPRLSAGSRASEIEPPHCRDRPGIRLQIANEAAGAGIPHADLAALFCCRSLCWCALPRRTLLRN